MRSIVKGLCVAAAAIGLTAAGTGTASADQQSYYSDSGGLHSAWVQLDQQNGLVYGYASVLGYPYDVTVTVYITMCRGDGSACNTYAANRQTVGSGVLVETGGKPESFGHVFRACMTGSGTPFVNVCTRWDVSGHES